MTFPIASRSSEPASIVRSVGDDARAVANQHGGLFHTTRWSVISNAGTLDSPSRQRALEELCRIYWEPVCIYVTTRGFSRTDAEDITQDIFSRFLSDETLQNVRRERGLFRHLILAITRHHVSNHVRKNQAQRRGSGDVPIALEDAPETRDPSVPADLAFDRAWARNVIAEATSKLRAEYSHSGRLEVFEALFSSLLGESAGGNQSEAARTLGMTVAGFKVALHRLRRRFGAAIVGEIGLTVSEADEIPEEVRYVLSVLETSPTE